VSPIVLATTAAKGNSLALPLVYVAIFVVFYFLFIRPQRRRQRALQAEQSAIAVGTEVLTSSGMYGRIVAENEDDTVLLEIAPGVPIRIARKAIVRTVTPAIPEVDSSPDDEPPAST
jgi:preprotein translocase subunit YajC